MEAPFQPLRACAAQKSCKWAYYNEVYRACQRKSPSKIDSNGASNYTKMPAGWPQQTVGVRQREQQDAGAWIPTMGHVMHLSDSSKSRMSHF
jgi:hypothetical protein